MKTIPTPKPTRAELFTVAVKNLAELVIAEAYAETGKPVPAWEDLPEFDTTPEEDMLWQTVGTLIQRAHAAERAGDEAAARQAFKAIADALKAHHAGDTQDTIPV